MRRLVWLRPGERVVTNAEWSRIEDAVIHLAEHERRLDAYDEAWGAIHGRAEAARNGGRRPSQRHLTAVPDGDGRDRLPERFLAADRG